MRRVTEVTQNIEGLALDICLSGRNAALHISTAKGRIVVRLPRSEVVDKYLAGRDSNGVPFTASITVMERLVQDAEITAPIGDTAAPRKRARRTAEAVAVGNEQAWLALRAGSRERMEVIAATHGVAVDKLYQFLTTHHADEWELLKRYRKGTASQTDLAALGFPLTKPGAKSL